MSAPPPFNFQTDRIEAYCPQCEGLNPHCPSCGVHWTQDRLFIATLVLAAAMIIAAAAAKWLFP